MKNSSKLLALGLVLFLGACSTTEDNFFQKVKNKTISQEWTVIREDGSRGYDGYTMGKFSTNGKLYYEGTFAMTFSKAIDTNTAIYIGTFKEESYSLTVTTSNGFAGSIFGSTPSYLSDKKEDIWLNVK